MAIMQMTPANNWNQREVGEATSVGVAMSGLLVIGRNPVEAKRE